MPLHPDAFTSDIEERAEHIALFLLAMTTFCPHPWVTTSGRVAVYLQWIKAPTRCTVCGAAVGDSVSLP